MVIIVVASEKSLINGGYLFFNNYGYSLLAISFKMPPPLKTERVKMSEKNRDSFVFYRSFYEAINDVQDGDKVKILNAICELALNDKEVELKGIAKTLFTLIKPQVTANIKKSLDGKKGGRPKTSGYENKKPVVFSAGRGWPHLEFGLLAPLRGTFSGAFGGALLGRCTTRCG